MQEIEHFDKDGNLIRSYQCVNEITHVKFDPPITVLKDETLSTTYNFGCPDCKDGYYYPFVGPREACQTCSKKPNDINFTERVAAIFSELLFLDLGGKIKMVKTFNHLWQTFTIDLNCSKDHSRAVLVAQKAVDMMVYTLTNQYKQAIAFENVYVSGIPASTEDMIYLISNFSSVSALVSMQETDIEFHFQFQVKVSI